MIVVVDYQKGNLLSVQRGLASVGAKAHVTSDPREIAAADAIVLPGVGAFADAAATMEKLGQMEVIRARVQEGAYFLGICLGMHLMFEYGLEGSPAEDVSAQGAGLPGEGSPAGNASRDGSFADAERESGAREEYARGLGLLPGLVGALPRVDAAGQTYKIPHVGWNSVSSVKENPLFAGIPQGEYFYFTHSYAAPNGSATIATTTHSVTFPCAVAAGERAFGVQFHPEKSSDAGLALLKNFVTYAKEA